MSGGKVRIESPNRDENTDRDQDHMHLKVQGQDGRSQGFKIKKTSVLNKLIEQYCILEGLEMKRIFFLFDGNRVCGTQTPAELNMQNDDTIKVYCENDSNDSTEIDLPQINEAEHEGDASITRDEFLKLKTQVHELQHQLYAAKSMLQTAFTLQPAFDASFNSLVGTCPDSPIKGTCPDSAIPRTPSPGGFNAEVTNAPTPSVHQSTSGKSPEEQLAILRAQNVRLTAEKVELVNSLHRHEQQSMALVVDQVRNIKQKMHASFAKSAELERQRAEKISHGLATVCREVEAAVRESMGVEHVETGRQRHLDDTNRHTNRSTGSYWTHSAANGGVASVASVARLWAAPDIARGANDTNVLSHHESDESELLPTRTTKWDVDSGGFARGRNVNTPPPRAKRGGRHSQSTSPQTHTTSPTPGRGYLTSGTLDQFYSDRSLRQENRGGGLSQSEGGASGRVSALEAPLRLSFQEKQKLVFSDSAAAQEEQAAKPSSFVDEAASGDASQLQIERLSWQSRAGIHCVILVYVALSY
jgi:small ubiquitin-related modifier